MHVIAADEVDRLLTFPALVDALAAVFASGAVPPERHHHPVGPGYAGPVHLLMPAWTADAPAHGSFLGVKIVNFYPGNARRGLPTITGTYLLHSGETGQALAVIDGTRLTLWRTAAASALASRFLSRPEARHLVMVGAGALAPFLIRAHAAVRPLDRITLWNHRRASATTLAATLTDPRWQVTVADDLATAVAEADIVSCATVSAVPLVLGAWLRRGSHLDLVGAFTLAMRETDDTAIQRARVFVDVPAALTEGGDVALALKAGAITADQIQGTLSDLCGGAVPGRGSADEITMFKSVGTGIEDLAAAMLVWQKAGL